MVKFPRRSRRQAQEEAQGNWVLTDARWEIERGGDPTLQFSLLNRDNGARVQSDRFPIAGIPAITQNDLNDGMYSVDGSTIHVRFPEFTFDINLTGYENDTNMAMQLSPFSDEWLSADTMQTEGQVRAEEMGYDLGAGGTFHSRSPKTKVPYPKRLKCACCKTKIHNPENIEGFLGAEETKRYIEYCKKMKIKPQMFCCTCFPSIQTNPTIMNAWNEMKAQVDKFSDMKHREAELLKREKELDKELKKIRSKKK